MLKRDLSTEALKSIAFRLDTPTKDSVLQVCTHVLMYREIYKCNFYFISTLVLVYVCIVSASDIPTLLESVFAPRLSPDSKKEENLAGSLKMVVK